MLHEIKRIIFFSKIAKIKKRDCAHSRLNAPWQPHIARRTITDKETSNHPNEGIRKFRKKMQ